mmetsp:Transcript_85960/g.246739  ORF Transcript_85960/g.246739 Transcript_85960/m.246739 type:complete len:220 (+) Transcript_85960:429-1088(+)
MPAAIGACAAAGAADAANCVAECGAGVYGAAPNGATTYGAACGAACAAGGGSDGAAAAAEAVAVGVGAAAAAEDEEAAGKEKAAGGAFPRVAGAQPALEEEEAAPAPTKLGCCSPRLTTITVRRRSCSMLRRASSLIFSTSRSNSWIRNALVPPGRVHSCRNSKRREQAAVSPMSLAILGFLLANSASNSSSLVGVCVSASERPAPSTASAWSATTVLN